MNICAVCTRGVRVCVYMCVHVCSINVHFMNSSNVVFALSAPTTWAAFAAAYPTTQAVFDLMLTKFKELGVPASMVSAARLKLEVLPIGNWDLLKYGVAVRCGARMHAW